MKTRRLDNNTVVSIPHEPAQPSYGDDVSEMVEGLENELRAVPADRARELMHEAARRIKAEDQEALRILAEYEHAEGSTLCVRAQSTASHV